MATAAAPANQLAAAAQWYATHGWPVFPCHPDTKMPLIKGGFKSASKGQDEIALWWRQWPNATSPRRRADSAMVWKLTGASIETRSVTGRM